MSPDKVMVVWVTVGNLEEAQNIATKLVEEKLAACVNIIPSIRSIYRWKGEICNDQESLLMIKTRADLFDPLKERVRSLHGYEVPEIIAVKLQNGYEPYISWVLESTRSTSQTL